MSEWQTVPLKEVATLNYGKDLSAIVDVAGSIPIHGTSEDVRWGRGYLYDGPSVILGRKGSIDRVKYVEGKFWTIDTAYYLSHFEEAVPKWLYYFLSSIDLRSLNEATGVPSLSRDRLYMIEVPKPPLPEQAKIAEVLSTVDRAIAQTEALIAKQQRIKTGLMADLLTRGIDADGNLRSEATHEFKDTPLGRIPVEWEVKAIKEVGTVVTGNTPSESAFDDDYQLVPFVTPADIGVTNAIHRTIRTFGKASATNVRIIHTGSICVVCIGSTIGKIGITVCETATNQQINSVIPHEPKISDLLFYSMLLNLPSQLRKEAGLQAVPIVNKSTFERLLIAQPREHTEAIEIQRQILGPAANAECGSRTLTKLRALKTALMQDLLTGEARVTSLLEKEEPG